MAIKHTIRKNGDKDTIKINLTPIKAIRKMCVECMGFQPTLVDGCTDPLCPIFPYRHGSRPIGFELVTEDDG